MQFEFKDSSNLPHNQRLHAESSDKKQRNSKLGTFYYNVLDYGAVGDDSTDNTPHFQQALSSAEANNGGIVLVPPGKYVFRGHITIPQSVTLKGTYQAPPSHGLYPSYTDYIGSVLLPLEGQGSKDGTPFIKLSGDATLQGFVIYYKEQPNEPSGDPLPYPYTIAMRGDNAAVLDCELLNPYQAISAVGAARHYIARITGQPILMGIFIDETYDIGRVENVHWNPWWSTNINVMNFQLTQGVAFEMARSDWEYVFNTFAFGYSVGYHFVNSSHGETNGNFLGIGCDMATKAAVLVEQSQPYGILITNGEFTSFVDKKWCTKCDSFHPTHVVVTQTNTGAVKFVNSAFWGPARQIAILDGDCNVSFSYCTFVQWDTLGKGEYGIESSNGEIILRGNEFVHSAPQAHMKKGTKKAIIIGNLLAGSNRIEVFSTTKSSVYGNVDDM